MKKLFIILSILITSFTVGYGQVFINSSGGIQPAGSTFAGYYGKYLQGGTKIVNDTIARDTIPSYYRDTTTFLCYTKSDSSFWILQGGILNSNFLKINPNGSGGGVGDSTYFFKNGGNSFGTDAILGTNDDKKLTFIRNGADAIVIRTVGSADVNYIDFKQNILDSIDQIHFYKGFLTGTSPFTLSDTTGELNFKYEQDTLFAGRNCNVVFPYGNNLKNVVAYRDWVDSNSVKAGYGLIKSTIGDTLIVDTAVGNTNLATQGYVLRNIGSTSPDSTYFKNGGNSFGGASYLGNNDSFPLYLKAYKDTSIMIGSHGLRTIGGGDYVVISGGQGLDASRASINLELVTTSRIFDLGIDHYLQIPNDTISGGARAIAIKGDSLYIKPIASGVSGSKWINVGGGGGGGTVTGSGVSQRIPYWNSTNNISYTNNLVYDTALIRLGIGTSTPSSPLDIHSSTNNMGDFNNSSYTGSSFLLFQKQDTTHWKIGNSYNSGANAFEIQNVYKLNTPISIDTNSRVTFLNSPYVGSNKILNASDSSIAGGYYPYYSNPKNYITLNSLSATRNTNSSIFTYNSSTGSYNLDTTKVGTITGVTAGIDLTGGGTSGSVTLNADTTTGSTKLATQGFVTRNSTNLTANAPISIVSSVIKADTTTRFTGLATIGKSYNDSLTLSTAINTKSQLNAINTFTTANYFKSIWANKDSLPITTGKTWGLIIDTTTGQIDRQVLSGGGLTGSGTVDSVLVPLTTWSVTNSKLSNTQRAYMNWDTLNHALNIGTSLKQTSYKLNVLGASQFVNPNGGASQGVVITNNNTTGQSLQIANGSVGGIYVTGTNYTLFADNVNSTNAGIGIYQANASGIAADLRHSLSTGTILNLTNTGGVSTFSGVSTALQITDNGTNYFSTGNGLGINWTMRRSISSVFAAVNTGNIGNVWVANQVANPISALTFKAYSANNGTNEVMRVTGNKTVQINTTSNSDTLTALQVNGSMSLQAANSKISINAATPTSASVGTSTLASGTVTVNTTAVTTNSIILIQRKSVNGSTALGSMTYSVVNNTSFTVTAVQPSSPASTEINDNSIFVYQIIN